MSAMPAEHAMPSAVADIAATIAATLQILAEHGEPTPSALAIEWIAASCQWGMCPSAIASLAMAHARWLEIAEGIARAHGPRVTTQDMAALQQAYMAGAPVRRIEILVKQMALRAKPRPQPPLEPHRT